ncbi:MAG: 4Fe-4S binding protein, partial [Parabacteroides sp.]|nr:4Fe-4S binding protein [Parabacteroides sp.]
MLKTTRRVLAVICFTLITLLFLDFTGTIHTWFGWLAKVQFLQAFFTLNIAIIVLWIVLTLLFGRVYCSVICPLGVFQDLISWISGKQKKNRFKYSPAISWLRYGILGLFILTIISGFTAWFSFIAPYSTYGRMASNLFAPVWQMGNNVLAYIAESIDSYAFYEVDIWVKSFSVLSVSIATFVIITALAWKYGRAYCNSICPVGTLLGFLARFSIFKPVIDTEKCNGCGLCARNCKASCINSKEHSIDYSRCVACMDCIDKCKQGAIQYIYRRKQEQPATNVTAADTTNSRRKFFSLTALLATTTLANAQKKKKEFEKVGDGGFADIQEKKAPNRRTLLVPPGALSIANFTQRCTACQLCVTVCTNQVLRPSERLNSFMQPEMSYERGYCRPECVKCSEVCPSGAIKPITKE